MITEVQEKEIRETLMMVRSYIGRGILKRNPFSGEDEVNLNLLDRKIQACCEGVEEEYLEKQMQYPKMTGKAEPKIDIFDGDESLRNNDMKVVERFGVNSGESLNEVFGDLVKRYIRPICDPQYEMKFYPEIRDYDAMRRRQHECVAIAFMIPRRVVSHCREDIKDEKGGKTNLFSYFVKCRDLEMVRLAFVRRLIQARYEYKCLGMYKDLEDADDLTVESIEKAAEQINAIGTMPTMT